MPRPITVLYEDDAFVVFDKRAGLLAIPSPKKEKNTLVDIVNRELKDPQAFRLHPCHRLDRDTSGVIIFAKGKKNQQLMMDEFKKGRVQKEYIAFVRGHIQKNPGEIKAPVVDYHQKKFSKHIKEKSAVTRYRVLTAAKGFSVLAVSPQTGKTNQIRIHFSQIGHPLLGERLYAFGKDFSVKFRRLALHARRIAFEQPVSHIKVNVSSPLPEDMRDFLKKHLKAEEFAHLPMSE